ncbi:FtsB family cell division protein [Allonocardiopsis opalescens]|uniref:FtsB family cell division protein n=1 Tax=Allonocardiopsis opalescens TaxID=1144618 RepID=UPI001FE32C18|nr:septum formation initiator family protein [Allonocardiopsis opalescens]
MLAIVVCAIALSVAYPLREYIAQRAEIAALAEEQARLREAIAALEERRDQLEDPVFTEREARNRLHYHYPGERSYVIVGGDDLAGSGADAAQADPDPWFSRLWQSVRAADRVPPAPDADSGERGAEEPAGTGTEGG